MSHPKYILAGALSLAAGWMAGLPRDRLSSDSASPVNPRPPAGKSSLADPSAVVARLLSDSSPAALAALAGNLPRLSSGELFTLLETLALRSPRPGGLDALLADAVADRLAGLDSGRAFEACAKFPTLRLPIAEALGRAAAGLENSQSKIWADRISGDEERNAFWKAFGARADASGIEGTTAAGGPAMEAYAERLASENPLKCQSWAMRHPEVWGKVAAVSALRDPRQALAWVEGLPDGASQTDARARVYGSWAASDPAAALAAFGADASPQSMGAVVHEMARAMAAQPPETIIAAIAGSPDAAFMKFSRVSSFSLAGSWLSEWVLRDPRASVETLLRLPDSSLRHDLIAKASLYWERGSTPELRENLTQAIAGEPAGENREALITALIRGGSRTGDADTAFQWLDARRDSPGFPEKLEAAVSSLADSGPAGLARHWDSLPREIRVPARTSLLNNWRMLDPAAADAWEARHPAE